MMNPNARIRVRDDARPIYRRWELTTACVSDRVRACRGREDDAHAGLDARAGTGTDSVWKR